MPKNPMDPLSKQWEKENCKLTLTACLVYGGVLLERLIGPLGLVVFFVGVWRLQGFLRNALAAGMLWLLFSGESQEVQIVRTLYFFGAFYVTSYLDGQDHKRKKDVRDWERED